MNIFKNWKSKKDSKSLLDLINNTAYTRHEFNGLRLTKVDLSPNNCLQILNHAKNTKTPISELNEEVGLELMNLVIGDRYQKRSTDLLASFLDSGYVVNDKMLQRLEFFNQEKQIVRGFHGSRSEDLCEFELLSEHMDGFVQTLQILNSFGANWSVPPIKSCEFATMEGFLYHQNLPSEKHIMKDFFPQQDGHALKNEMIGAQDILNRRAGTSLMDDGEIQIQTGDSVLIQRVANKTMKKKMDKGVS